MGIQSSVNQVAATLLGAKTAQSIADKDPTSLKNLANANPEDVESMYHGIKSQVDLLSQKQDAASFRVQRIIKAKEKQLKNIKNYIGPIPEKANLFGGKK